MRIRGKDMVGRQRQMHWPKAMCGCERSSCIKRVRGAGRGKQERRDKVQEVMLSRSFGPWKSIKDFDFDFIFLGSKITIDGNCSH